MHIFSIQARRSVLHVFLLGIKITGIREDKFLPPHFYTWQRLYPVRWKPLKLVHDDEQ